MRAILRHVDAYLVGIRFHFGGLWWQIQGMSWTDWNHDPGRVA